MLLSASRQVERRRQGCPAPHFCVVPQALQLKQNTIVENSIPLHCRPTLYSAAPWSRRAPGWPGVVPALRLGKVP